MEKTEENEIRFILCVIELPEDLQVHRSTAIGVITFSKNKELANKFIDFIVSEKGSKIYEEYRLHHAE